MAARRAGIWAVAAADSGRLVFGRAIGHGCEMKSRAVGLWRAVTEFGSVVSRDANLHLKVLYFISPKGRGLIFFDVNRLLEQCFFFRRFKS